MRYLGGLMILAGSLGLGIWYREQFRLRLVYLRQMVTILEMFMSEIRYGKTTLPESCKSVGMQVGGTLGDSMLETFEKMQANTGEVFGEIFCGFLEEAMTKLPLEAEDREVFLKFAKQNSFADSMMQLKTIEQSRDILQETIKRLEKITEEKGRLAVGLGAMSGLLLVIVLL